jgi:hypothetical protein
VDVKGKRLMVHELYILLVKANQRNMNKTAGQGVKGD